MQHNLAICHNLLTTLHIKCGLSLNFHYLYSCLIFQFSLNLSHDPTFPTLCGPFSEIRVSMREIRNQSSVSCHTQKTFGHSERVFPAFCDVIKVDFGYGFLVNWHEFRVFIRVGHRPWAKTSESRYAKIK